MRNLTLLFNWLFLTTSISAVAAERHLHEFNQARLSADEAIGMELRCRLILDQERIKISFSEAGILAEDIPLIDWNLSAAVLISPKIYIQDYRPRITSLRRESNKSVVEWEFVEGGPDLAESSISIQKKGGVRTRVTTQGSTDIGPEALLLVTSRKHILNNKVVCRGPKTKVM